MIILSIILFCLCNPKYFRFWIFNEGDIRGRRVNYMNQEYVLCHQKDMINSEGVYKFDCPDRYAISVGRAKANIL